MPDHYNTVSYPAKFLKHADGSYSVTFRDIPEAITQGDTLEEAKQMAGFALDTAFQFYREYVRHIPAPTAPEEGEILITVKRP